MALVPHQSGTLRPAGRSADAVEVGEQLTVLAGAQAAMDPARATILLGATP